MKTASFFTYQGLGAISIALYAPRGKNHLPRCGRLAPTHDMLKMDEATYRTLYFGNILGRLDAAQLWEDLHRLSYPHEPVLLCWGRPPLTGRNWCHRRMIAEFFSSELGHNVQEIGGVGL